MDGPIIGIKESSKSEVHNDIQKNTKIIKNSKLVIGLLKIVESVKIIISFCGNGLGVTF